MAEVVAKVRERQAVPGRQPARWPGRAAARRLALVVGLLALVGACAAEAPPVRIATAEGEAPRPAPRPAIMLASAAGNYLAGTFAQRTRDYGSAADFLSSALALDAKNRRLRRRAFLAMVASGRMDEAARLAAAVVADDRGASIANLSLVVEDVRRGDYGAASKRLAQMPRRGINAFTVPLLHAWSLAGEGKTDAALAALEELAATSSFSALRSLHAALIDDLAGRAAAAEAAYRAALGNRATLRVVQGFAAFLARAGRRDEARKVLRNYLAENPDSALLTPAMAAIERGETPPRLVSDARAGIAEVFFNLTGTLAQGRSSDHALIYGRLALRLKPDFPLAKMLVAGILESLDREEEALALYDAIDAASPLAWSARLRKAAGLDALGRTDAAIRQLEAMVAERPKRADAAIRLGDLLRSKKRYREAVAAYTRALGRVGKPGKRHWSVFYARGIAFERSKLWSQAEQDFLRALELSPDQPYVLNYLGYSWVDRGIHLARAQEMIERAVSLRPNDGYIVDSLGWVLYRLGHYQRATEQLERAVVLRPEDPTINDHLGDAYWRVGRLQEARFQWRRALALNPEADMIPAIERKIRQGLTEAVPQDGHG